MKFFFIAIFSLFFFTGCNYNFFLAKKLEKEKKYEEANIEYSRAYFKYLGINKKTHTHCNSRRSCLLLKYKNAYEKNTLQVVPVLRERYILFILKKKYFSAYKVLEKALLLVPDDKFFKAEQIHWKKVLLAGKINILKEKGVNVPILGDKVYPFIRFNSPNPTHFIETIITPDGQFAVEDVVYRPDSSAFLRYSIQSIGLKYLPLGRKAGKTLFQDSEFISYPLVDFRIPVLTKHTGDFLFIKSDKTKKQSQNFSREKNYWYPNRDFEYSSSIQGQKIRVTLKAQRNEFLPNLVYFNANSTHVFLDYGLLDLKRGRVSFLWGIKRIAGEGTIKNLKQNYYYRPYLKFTFLPFYIVAKKG